MSSYNAAAETATSDPVIFTDAAAQKVHELICEEEGEPKLRVYIEGGGCSGFQYGFTFDENPPQADDTIIEKTVNDEDEDDGGEGGANAVQLLIDPMSFQYLIGAEIDYREDLQGSQFVIRNPNAKTTCGCGSSFAV